MFNRHLPDVVYENLPRLYIAVAALLLFADSGWRWLPIICLVTTWYLTVSRRRRNRCRPMISTGATSRRGDTWVIAP